MKILKFMMVAIMMLWLALPSQAVADQSVTVSMTKSTTNKKEGPEYPEKNDRGRRQPAMSIECVIDATAGIEFAYGETPEFVIYEICDNTGMTVASFTEEESFISTLFSLSGEYQLRLVCDDYIYQGWVIL